MFIIITSSHWLTHGQLKYWYGPGITQLRPEKFSLFYWACSEPPAGKCRMSDEHKTPTFHSLILILPTQNMMPTVWRKDSKEVISNKIVMKPSHCMRWFLENYASTGLTKRHELSPPVWECGKYRQISGHKSLLILAPREREERNASPDLCECRNHRES